MNLTRTLTEVASTYPSHMIDGQLRDVERISYNISLAVNGHDPNGLSICDIGGGLGLFSTGCAALGMKVTLIDDFRDPVNFRLGSEPLSVHQKLGVTVESRDVIEQGIEDLPQFDIITSFDSMEHWHNSPKKLFSQVRKHLKPGGRFVLGVPNCVNLRKRLTVPLGYGKWTSMEQWYEQPRFREHVREPDVDDLYYIARDMNLSDVHVHGRNWVGRNSGNPVIRLGTMLVDKPLRLFPTLCGDIYLTGHTSSRS